MPGGFSRSLQAHIRALQRAAAHGGEALEKAAQLPPPWYADWFFWASFIDLAGACGYVTGDALRGYFSANILASNVVYLFLGWGFLLESLCFCLSWRQATYDVGFWPHMFTEYLNIFCCGIYALTSVLYWYETTGTDSTGITVAYTVLWLEFLAVICFLTDACMYFYTWCVDNVYRIEPEETSSYASGHGGKHDIEDVSRDDDERTSSTDGMLARPYSLPDESSMSSLQGMAINGSAKGHALQDSESLLDKLSDGEDRVPMEGGKHADGRHQFAPIAGSGTTARGDGRHTLSPIRLAARGRPSATADAASSSTPESQRRLIPARLQLVEEWRVNSPLQAAAARQRALHVPAPAERSSGAAAAPSLSIQVAVTNALRAVASPFSATTADEPLQPVRSSDASPPPTPTVANAMRAPTTSAFTNAVADVPDAAAPHVDVVTSNPYARVRPPAIPAHHSAKQASSATGVVATTSPVAVATSAAASEEPRLRELQLAAAAPSEVREFDGVGTFAETAARDITDDVVANPLRRRGPGADRSDDAAAAPQDSSHPFGALAAAREQSGTAAAAAASRAARVQRAGTARATAPSPPVSAATAVSDAAVVRALKVAEKSSRMKRCGNRSRVYAFLVWHQFGNAEMQEHIWNVIPSIVYLVANITGVTAQYSTYYNNLFGAPPPLPRNTSVLVPAANCYPNVYYSPDDAPPCNNPYLWNATRVISNVTCYEAVPPIEQPYPCNDTAQWPASWRNTSQVVNGTRCWKHYPYEDPPCNSLLLWAPRFINTTRCFYYRSLPGGSQDHIPCNDPYLWDGIRNGTASDGGDSGPAPYLTVGGIIALQISSQGYVIGDALYAFDAAIVLYAWWLYTFDRDREHAHAVAKLEIITAKRRASPAAKKDGERQRRASGGDTAMLRRARGSGGAAAGH